MKSKGQIAYEVWHKNDIPHYRVPWDRLEERDQVDFQEWAEDYERGVAEQQKSVQPVQESLFA